MGCNCGKPKCDGHCGVSPAVLQINNPSECTLFRKVEIPTSMGTSVENPPKTGAYRNVLLYYKADGEAYLYSSDGIPTKITGTVSVKQPTAFTMQYAEGLAGWQSGDNYELVKETTGTPTDYIYRANKFYYGGADVSFLNEKTGVVFTPQELYAWLIDGNEAVINHVPLGWTVNNDAEILYTGNYIDGIWLKKETRTSQSGNTISFNGSAFVTASISRASGYERVQDTLGITISGYENDGAMVYDLISIDGFSLYGSVQESSPII